MCGIVGYLALDGAPVDTDALRPMLDAIRHRGPDAEGIHSDGGLAYGMRRLAVIDLLTGEQPITDPRSGLVITYNGETYNFKELRRRLEASGVAFRTKTDTEVVLQQYVAHGLDGLAELNGMFAFAVWDPRRRKLVLARDPVGIKPLFWWEGDWEGRPCLVWSSELRALLRHPAVPARISDAGLSEFLRFGYNFAPRTVLDGVFKLEPGGWLSVEDGRITQGRYATPPMEAATGDRPRSMAAAAELIRTSLHDAVRDQMVADVPVGAFLSGGIDSSALVAMMRDVAGDNVQTFSIGFGSDDQFHDEATYAAEFAKRLGTRHHELRIDPDLLGRLPAIAAHLDEPVADSSIVMSYLISELARKHVTVALSGVGGDELFGGYRRYLGYSLDRWFQGPLGPIARGAVRAGVAVLPKSRDSSLANLARLASRYVRARSGSTVERYAELVELGADTTLGRLFPGYSRPAPAAVAALEGGAFADSLEAMTAFDMRGSLPEQLLNLTDRMSMAVSLEVRVPYLDHRVLAAARATPSRFKIQGRRLRVVQKEAVRELIGEDVLQRKKRGFGFPLGRWIRDESAGFIEDHIGTAAVANRGVLRPDVVAALRGEHERREADHTDVLTGLLFLELWFRSVID